ncbi:MAG: redoxin domain-containing protein [Anaerolineae bacterium]
MPKWIQIDVKDKEGRSARPRSAATGKASGNRSLLLGSLAGLVVVLAIVGAGFLLQRRFFGGGGVVAVVNGQSITQQELADELTLFVTMSTLTQGSPPANPPKDFDILNQMIADRLKYAQAAGAGITVSSEQVEAQIAAIEAEAGFTEAQLRSALAQAGLDRSVLQEWLRRQIAISAYLSNVLLVNVPQEQQEAATRNWSNALQTQADVEIRLGTTGTRRAAKIGEPAPDFTLPTPDGESVTLSELRGRPVLVNFWATWCPPCKIEMPDIENLYQKYKDQGFTVIAVDQQESPDAVRQYFADMGLSFQPVIDSSGEIFNLYRVVALPTSYFIDSDGIVRFQHRGLMTRDQMEGYATQVLAK